MRYTRIILIFLIPISLFSEKLGQYDDIENFPKNTNIIFTLNLPKQEFRIRVDDVKDIVLFDAIVKSKDIE